MMLSDWIGFALFVALGLWWVVFPRSVIRFYTWFNRREIKASPIAVRIIGLAWVGWVTIVCFILRK